MKERRTNNYWVTIMEAGVTSRALHTLSHLGFAVR